MSFKKYKDMVSEMAIRNGITNSNSNNKQRDWEWYQNNLMYLTLVQEKIGSKHYKVYKVGQDARIYFLVTEKNEYAGSISGVLKGKKFYIDTTHADRSKIERGFYQTIFGVILSNKVEEILSDGSLSTSAIKSYLKINKISVFDISVKVPGNTYIEFTEENLFSDKNNVISIKSKFIRERFKKYYKTLGLEYSGGLSSSLFRMYESYSEDIDGWLFGEIIEDEF